MLHEFNENHVNWGFTSFMPLVELRDPEKGFIVKDVCIVGAEVFVCKTTNENQVKQVANITSRTLTSQDEVEVHNKSKMFKTQVLALNLLNTLMQICSHLQ